MLYILSDNDIILKTEDNSNQDIIIDNIEITERGRNISNKKRK